MKKALVRKYLKRLLIVSLISFVMVFAFSEIAFYFQRDRSINRSPQTITLVIPAGTAQKVEAGGEIPEIPSEMTFVLGDVLEVKNEDTVTHQLGPLYVPPGSSAALPLNEADHFTLGCSFQTNQYLDMDVREPTTIQTRLVALFTAGPATILFLYLNSLLFFPIHSHEEGENQDT